MNMPKVNATVAAVREAWAGIEAYRALRRSLGGRHAEPMAGSTRVQNYVCQTGSADLTPKQIRRFSHKYNRTLRTLAVSR